MGLPTPTSAMLALAAFVRDRLGEVGDTMAPFWPRPDRGPVPATRTAAPAFVGASDVFAPTSYARARLLRQMHASGLLSEREADDAMEVLGVAQ